MSGSGSLHRLQDDQALGVLPGNNVWLAASAGTGKTQVLTGRVLRLLLDDVPPSRILGLTFTKAGAAEMAQRVRTILAEWVQLPRSELAEQIFAIGGAHLDETVVARARTLFAKVIDAPGSGLAFQTIHSFCQSLLAAFPLEAGLVPGFRAVDDAEAAILKRDLLASLTEQAHAAGEATFLRDLAGLAERVGEADALRWLDRCAAAGAAILTLPPAIAPYLRQLFALPVSDPADWLMRWCTEAADVAGWREISNSNIAWGTDTGRKRAAVIAQWLEANSRERATQLSSLLGTVRKTDGDLYADYGKRQLAIADLAARCADAAGEALHTAAAMAASDRYAAALTVGRTFAAAWASYKQKAGLVDFDDLIAHAVALLNGGGADWIRYKLDQRIDHILVDEAQDTNAAQWTIVKRLAEEYFAGVGAKDPDARTLFVVGDYKQAIFGFQGTDPANFREAETWFRQRGEAADRPFARLNIATSYRCAPAVLETVDAVAARLGPERFGLGSSEQIRHAAAFGKSGGMVTLWPCEPATSDSSANDDEGDSIGEESWIDDATRRVADRIAVQVRHWLDHGHDGQDVRAGDVLVLVRKRKELAGLIVSRMQARGVPVAGVDRLSLDKPLAVQDLLAAARFAIQPLDDFNLACLLVSPLGGFSQDDLWLHGAGRGTTPLWPHLRAQPAIEPRLEPLRQMLAMADYVSPHLFFETLLSGQLQGRAKLLRRLGNAARDPIEELLSQALEFGQTEGPSLHRFLRWFDSRDNDIKRETDVAGEEARVMTVHGAKGLEARFVILADAAGNPDAKPAGSFTWTVSEGQSLPVTGFKQADQPALLAEAQAEQAARERREHWRLLYVAMTRAKEGLFVTGALGKREHAPAPESWYAAIAAAMDDLGAMDAIDPLWSRTRVHALPQDRRKRSRAKAQDKALVTMPGWAQTTPPEEPRPLRPLSPSMLAEVAALSVPLPPASDGMAARRGTLMHALFERLPPVALSERRKAGAAWLDAQASDIPQKQRTEMLESVLSVLDDLGFAALFSADGLAEAPLSALVNGRVIAGTVDRLLVRDDQVTVLDFKTGVTVPETAGAVPPQYLAQMAAYRAALGQIFPGHEVHAALLYTSAPRLIPLPSELLDTHAPDR